MSQNGQIIIKPSQNMNNTSSNFKSFRHESKQNQNDNRSSSAFDNLNIKKSQNIKIFSGSNQNYKFSDIIQRFSKKNQSLQGFDTDKLNDENIKLKTEINRKNKEIHNLKVEYNRLEEENRKNNKIISDFINEASKFNPTVKSLQEGINNDNMIEIEKINEDKNEFVNNYLNVNDSKNNTPNYMNRLNFNSINPANIIKLREVFMINNLKKQIHDFKAIIRAKDEEILKLKSDKKISNYAALENDYQIKMEELFFMKENFEKLKDLYNLDEIKIKDIFEEKEYFKVSYNKLKTQFEDQKSKLKIFQEEYVKLQKNLELVNNKVNSRGNLVNGKKEPLTLQYREKIQDLESSIATMKEDNDLRLKKIKELEKAILTSKGKNEEEIELRVSTYKKSIKDLELKISKLEEGFQNSSKEKSIIENLQLKLEENEKTIQKLNGVLKTNDEVIRSNKEIIEENETKMNHLRVKIETLKEKLLKSEEKLINTLDELKSCEDKLSKTEKTANNLTINLQDTENMYTEILKEKLKLEDLYLQNLNKNKDSESTKIWELKYEVSLNLEFISQRKREKIDLIIQTSQSDTIINRIKAEIKEDIENDKINLINDFQSSNKFNEDNQIEEYNNNDEEKFENYDAQVIENNFVEENLEKNDDYTKEKVSVDIADNIEEKKLINNNLNEEDNERDYLTENFQKNENYTQKNVEDNYDIDDEGKVITNNDEINKEKENNYNNVPIEYGIENENDSQSKFEKCEKTNIDKGEENDEFKKKNLNTEIIEEEGNNIHENEFVKENNIETVENNILIDDDSINKKNDQFDVQKKVDEEKILEDDNIKEEQVKEEIDNDQADLAKTEKIEGFENDNEKLILASSKDNMESDFTNKIQDHYKQITESENLRNQNDEEYAIKITDNLHEKNENKLDKNDIIENDFEAIVDQKINDKAQENIKTPDLKVENDTQALQNDALHNDSKEILTNDEAVKQVEGESEITHVKHGLNDNNNIVVENKNEQVVEKKDNESIENNINLQNSQTQVVELPETKILDNSGNEKLENTQNPKEIINEQKNINNQTENYSSKEIEDEKDENTKFPFNNDQENKLLDSNQNHPESLLKDEKSKQIENEIKEDSQENFIHKKEEIFESPDNHNLNEQVISGDNAKEFNEINQEEITEKNEEKIKFEENSANEPPNINQEKNIEEALKFNKKSSDDNIISTINQKINDWNKNQNDLINQDQNENIIQNENPGNNININSDGNEELVNQNQEEVENKNKFNSPVLKLSSVDSEKDLELKDEQNIAKLNQQMIGSKVPDTNFGISYQLVIEESEPQELKINDNFFFKTEEMSRSPSKHSSRVERKVNNEFSELDSKVTEDLRKGVGFDEILKSLNVNLKNK